MRYFLDNNFFAIFQAMRNTLTSYKYSNVKIVFVQTVLLATRIREIIIIRFYRYLSILLTYVTR